MRASAGASEAARLRFPGLLGNVRTIPSTAAEQAIAAVNVWKPIAVNMLNTWSKSLEQNPARGGAAAGGADSAATQSGVRCVGLDGGGESAIRGFMPQQPVLRGSQSYGVPCQSMPRLSNPWPQSGTLNMLEAG